MSKDRIPSEWQPDGGWTPESLAVYGVIDADEYIELTADYGQSWKKLRTPAARARVAERGKASWEKRRKAKAAEQP